MWLDVEGCYSGWVCTVKGVLTLSYLKEVVGNQLEELWVNLLFKFNFPHRKINTYYMGKISNCIERYTIKSYFLVFSPDITSLLISYMNHQKNVSVCTSSI